MCETTAKVTLKRKRNRLKEYDYSRNGMYFVTVCTKNKEKIFWENQNNDNIANQYDNAVVGANCVRPLSDLPLSEYGIIIKNEVEKISDIYDNLIKIENYVIMPNHIHLLIFIDTYGRTLIAPTISRVVKQFKGSVTKQIGKPIFQKSFHDHIIRSDEDYEKIYNYIQSNPSKWTEDCFYVE